MKGERVLLEQRSEAGNKTLDKIEHVLQHFKDRFTLDNPRLIERDLEGELLILVHFIIRGTNEELIACIQREKVVSGPDAQTRDGNSKRLSQRLLQKPSHVTCNVYALKGRTSGDKESMLIDLVQAVETPKRVISSFVRFDRVNRVYGVLPHALYFSRLSGFVLRGRVKEREVDMEEWPRLPRADQNKLISQMVKGAAKVLDNVSGNDCDVRRDILNADEVIDWSSRHSVAPGSDFVWGFSDKGFDSAIQIVDVLVGPCDFRINACEPVNHEVSLGYGGEEDSQNTEGSRDTDSHAVELHARPQEGCEAEEAVSRSPPPDALVATRKRL